MKTCWEFGCRLREAMIDIGLACLLMSAAACEAGALPDGWSVDVRQHAAVDRTYKQGESIDMTVTLRSGFAPLDLTGARTVFYWYTNAAQNVWWTNAAAIVSARGGTVAVRWTPAMDVGASAYPYWLGVWTSGSTSPIWRVNGTIRMLPSPGFTPNALELPIRTLDFAAIAITNSAWITAEAWKDGSNALASAVQEHANRAGNPHGITAAQIGAITGETDSAALEALATNRVPRLQTFDGLNTLDATGQVTRVTGEDAIWYLAIPDPSASTNEITALRGAPTAARFSGTVAGYYCDWGNFGPGSGEQGIVDDGAGNMWSMVRADYLASGYTNFVFAYGPFGSANVFRVLIPAVTNLDTLVTRGEAENRYAISNHLSEVAFDGLYNSLSDRPVVLASNGIASASHCWGVGFGGWTGWAASGITLTPSNAVLSGNSGGFLETVGLITGIVDVTQSGIGVNGYDNEGLVTLSFDDGANWYPIGGLPAKSVRAGGTKLRISIPETPGLPGSTPKFTLNSVVVDTWIDASRAAEVFPLHAVSVRSDLPSDALDVANKAYVDAVCGLAQKTADRALTWWNNPAEDDAYLNGHRLHLGGGWSLLGDRGSFAALSNDGSVGLGVVGDSAQFSVQLANENILVARFDTAMMQILAWSGVASNMWLSVSTNGLPASADSASAWVEYCAALDSGVWAHVPEQSVALPTNASAFRISFTNPRWGQTNGYFRVMRQSGSLAALRSMVPLRAPSIMISESNSVAVATAPGVLTLDSIDQAPAAIANHAQLYSVLGELWAMDGDGNATRLSTHDGPLWVARSLNVYTGWGTSIDMVSGVRTRFRLTELRSWESDQKSIEDAQKEAIKRWQETPAASRRTTKPLTYVAKPEPAWMREQRLATEDPQPVTKK